MVMAKIENNFDLVKKSSENQVEKINQVVYKDRKSVV